MGLSIAVLNGALYNFAHSNSITEILSGTKPAVEHVYQEPHVYMTALPSVLKEKARNMNKYLPTCL